MINPLQATSLPIRLIGTPGFLPGLISHIKSASNLQNLPIENVLFQSILLCLIAGGQNLIFRVPEEDISLVVKLTNWTLAHVFNLPTHRLKLKHARTSHLKQTHSSVPRRTFPVNDADTFLYSLFMPPSPIAAAHSPYSSLSSPLYEPASQDRQHSPPMSPGFHNRSQSSGQRSSIDATIRPAGYPFPPTSQHNHSTSVGSDPLRHYQSGESLLMHTNSTATNNTGTSTNTTIAGAYPHLVKPRPLYAFDAPARMHQSNSQGSGRRKRSGQGFRLKSLASLELPKALVISGLEHASEDVQTTFATVLKERRVFIEPHVIGDISPEANQEKDQEQLGGDWPLPEGFITVYICAIDPKERPKVHKSLLDHFSMSTNVVVPQAIRNEFKTYYSAPPSSRPFAFGSSSNPGSPPGMQSMSLPSSHTPPIFNKPLPLPMHHRSTSSSSQNHSFNPPTLPPDLIPSSFISALQESQKNVHISPYMGLYMADLFSAVRNHYRVDGSLITRRAMIQAEALVKACRVLGVDLSGMELIRPAILDDEESDVASSFKDEHDYLSVNMGYYGPGTTIASMNTSREHHPLLWNSPAATAEGEYPPSSRHAPELRLEEPLGDEEDEEERELDVTEVDVARIIPRIVSHRLRIRDGPDDEILSGAVFSAAWKFKLDRGEEEDVTKAGHEPRLAYDDDDKLQTVKAVLVQVLSQV